MPRYGLVFGAVWVIAAALVFPSYGGNSGSSLKVPLKAVNGSAQSGVAILTQVGSGSASRVRVVVKIRRGKPEPGEPAHVHKVTCAQYARIAPNPRMPTPKQFGAQGATISDVLNSLDGGKSISTVYEPLAKLTTGHYSINVHQASGQNMAVACGNIPKRRSEERRVGKECRL